MRNREAQTRVMFQEELRRVCPRTQEREEKSSSHSKQFLKFLDSRIKEAKDKNAEKTLTSVPAGKQVAKQNRGKDNRTLAAGLPNVGPRQTFVLNGCPLGHAALKAAAVCSKFFFNPSFRRLSRHCHLQRPNFYTSMSCTDLSCHDLFGHGLNVRVIT